MFHVKHLIISFLFFCFWSNSHSQYAKYSFSDKPEPEIKIPIDERIERKIFIQIQGKQIASTEKDLLYWMDFARAYPRRFFDDVVIPLVNNQSEIAKQKAYIKSLKADLYNSKPLPLLILDQTLFSMAREHVNDVKKNSPSIAHTSGQGLNFSQRLKQFGINVCASENLSYGGSSVLMQLVLLYLDIGEPELGHRKTLLNPVYTNVGVAAAVLSTGEIFVVQDFSCKP